MLVMLASKIPWAELGKNIQHDLLKPLVYFSFRCEEQSFACV